MQVDPQTTTTIVDAASHLTPFPAVVALVIVVVIAVGPSLAAIVYQRRVSKSPLLNGEGLELFRQMAGDQALTRESSQTGNILLQKLTDTIIIHDKQASVATGYAKAIDHRTGVIEDKVDAMSTNQQVCMARQGILSTNK